MNHFQQALETIRDTGVRNLDVNGRIIQIDPKLVPVELIDILENTIPFVFKKIKLKDVEASLEPIKNPPFDHFSLEVENTLFGTYNDDPTQFIVCIICTTRSISPRVIDTLLLIFDSKTNRNRVDLVSGECVGEIVNYLLNLIPDMAIGRETINKSIKIGKGKSQRYATYKNIIHICPKKLKASYETTGSARLIDWKYRFSVRGHWRHIKGFGRDAQGGEQIGRTWVKNYVKGAHDLPLTIKERHVKHVLEQSPKT